MQLRQSRYCIRKHMGCTKLLQSVSRYAFILRQQISADGVNAASPMPNHPDAMLTSCQPASAGGAGASPLVERPANCKKFTQMPTAQGDPFPSSWH